MPGLLCFYDGHKQAEFCFSHCLLCVAKECRVQETRQTSPTANKENIKPLDSSPSITRPVCKGTVYIGEIQAEISVVIFSFKM